TRHEQTTRGFLRHSPSNNWLQTDDVRLCQFSKRVEENRADFPIESRVLRRALRAGSLNLEKDEEIIGDLSWCGTAATKGTPGKVAQPKSIFGLSMKKRMISCVGYTYEDQSFYFL